MPKSNDEKRFPGFGESFSHITLLHHTVAQIFLGERPACAVRKYESGLHEAASMVKIADFNWMPAFTKGNLAAFLVA